MIRHVVMFRWVDGTTDEQIAAVSEGLAELPGLMPEIRRYEFGADLALAEGNLDFVVVADFDDVDAYISYRDNADHQSLIAQVIRPVIAERVAVQYEI